MVCGRNILWPNRSVDETSRKQNRHTKIYFEYRKFLRISEILKRTCLPTHFCIDSAATENGEQ
jgi:hypothetical protein